MKGDKVVEVAEKDAKLKVFPFVNGSGNLNFCQVIRIYSRIARSCAIIQDNLHKPFALNKTEQKVPINERAHLCISS